MPTYGIFLSSEETTPRALVEQARSAERAGFSTVTISDHFHPWMDSQGESPFVWSVIGGIAATTGRFDPAAQHLEDALVQLEAANMPLHLAAARRRLGELRADRGTAEGDQWMRDHGIRNPAAFARMLVPGRFSRG